MQAATLLLTPGQTYAPIPVDAGIDLTLTLDFGIRDLTGATVFASLVHKRTGAIVLTNAPAAALDEATGTFTLLIEDANLVQLDEHVLSVRLVPDGAPEEQWPVSPIEIVVRDSAQRSQSKAFLTARVAEAERAEADAKLATGDARLYAEGNVGEQLSDGSALLRSARTEAERSSTAAVRARQALYGGVLNLWWLDGAMRAMDLAAKNLDRSYTIEPGGEIRSRVTLGTDLALDVGLDVGVTVAAGVFVLDAGDEDITVRFNYSAGNDTVPATSDGLYEGTAIVPADVEYVELKILNNHPTEPVVVVNPSWGVGLAPIFERVTEIERETAQDVADSKTLYNAKRGDGPEDRTLSDGFTVVAGSKALRDEAEAFALQTADDRLQTGLDRAQTAIDRADAQAASQAARNANPSQERYPDLVTATNAAEALATGTVVVVEDDESVSNLTTSYRVEAGALVGRVVLDTLNANGVPAYSAQIITNRHRNIVHPSVGLVADDPDAATANSAAWNAAIALGITRFELPDAATVYLRGTVYAVPGLQVIGAGTESGRASVLKKADDWVFINGGKNEGYIDDLFGTSPGLWLADNASLCRGIKFKGFIAEGNYFAPETQGYLAAWLAYEQNGGTLIGTPLEGGVYDKGFHGGNAGVIVNGDSHGFRLFNTWDVEFEEIRCQYWTEDGVYAGGAVGGTMRSNNYNWKMNDVACYRNGRNGYSIIDLTKGRHFNLRVEENNYASTQGFDPAASPNRFRAGGVDLEPNKSINDEKCVDLIFDQLVGINEGTQVFSITGADAAKMHRIHVLNSTAEWTQDWIDARLADGTADFLFPDNHGFKFGGRNGYDWLLQNCKTVLAPGWGFRIDGSSVPSVLVRLTDCVAERCGLNQDGKGFDAGFSIRHCLDLTVKGAEVLECGGGIAIFNSTGRIEDSYIDNLSGPAYEAKDAQAEPDWTPTEMRHRNVLWSKRAGSAAGVASYSETAVPVRFTQAPQRGYLVVDDANRDTYLTELAAGKYSLDAAGASAVQFNVTTGFQLNTILGYTVGSELVLSSVGAGTVVVQSWSGNNDDGRVRFGTGDDADADYPLTEYEWLSIRLVENEWHVTGIDRWARRTRAAKPAIAQLGQVISDPPTQAEVQALSDAFDTLVSQLKA